MAATTPTSVPPQTSTDANPGNPQDAGKGGRFPTADPATTGNPYFVGTTAGNGGPKPFKVK
jgi:hypothetical protein